MAGLAPFFAWGYGGQPEIIRISPLGAGITDYLDILTLPEFSRACSRLTFEHLAELEDWHVCDLQELRAESPLLSAPLPDGLDLRNVPCGVCPVIGLPPRMDDLLSQLDAKFRTDLRRAENRLRKHASLEIVQADRSNWKEILDALFRLHTARWQERQESGVLDADALRAFHREAAERFLEGGMLRLYGLFAGGDCIAVQYNLSAKSRVYAYLSGFEPAWSKFSPGTVLLGYSIACAIEEGAAEFDFLRKRESFKYNWCARDRVNRRLVLSRGAQAAQEVA